MKALVLGGYGLIGLAVVKRLLRKNIEVVALGRSQSQINSHAKLCTWIVADLATLTHKEQWQPIISGVDIVINAAGVLQSNWHTSISSIQETAIKALIDACEEDSLQRFIQISAPGVAQTSSTEFLRSKFEADKHLMNSSLDWTLLRPGLVLSPQAFGGTALLRSLAAFPAIQPLVQSEKRLQTVLIVDVTEAVVECIGNKQTISGVYDLMETESHTLEEIVAAFRHWLGFKPAAFCLDVPLFIAYLVSKIADFAGQLGWRSPLRTTALKVLQDQVLGSPDAWTRTTNKALCSLQQSLEQIPATRQERLFARMQLAFPAVLSFTAIFWILSGVVGLFRIEQATAIVEPALGANFAISSVVIGSFADIAIGLAFLVRRFFRMACMASMAVAALYLLMATLFTPQLWLDPLGPLMKIIPSIALSTLLLAMTDER